MRSILSAMLCSLLILAGCSENKEEPTAGTQMEQSRSDRDATADTGAYEPAPLDNAGDMASEDSETTDSSGELGAMESGDPAAPADAGSTTPEEADTMIEGSGNP